MFISFIVPVYNVENYVRKCIDSLLALSMPDFEILLVIGHSEDASDEICRKYENKDKRIRVICQNGKGLSDARNCGLRVACGNYVAFIDSDDYVATEELQNLLTCVQVMPEVDVFVSDFIRVFDNGKLVVNCQIAESVSPILGTDYLEQFLRKPGCFWNVWRYIYKKEFLLQNQLWFKQEAFSEDVDYTIRVLLICPQIAFFHNPYYYYRVRRPASLMSMNTLKRLTDTVETVSECAVWAAESNYPYRQGIIEHMVVEWVLNMAVILELPGKDRPKAVELFQVHKNVVLLSQNPIYRCLFAGCSRLFGVLPLAVCLQLAKKAKRFFGKYF